ncbi:MAG: hypothetical protein WDO74_10775 [Pseudomonadota bacterium]
MNAADSVTSKIHFVFVKKYWIVRSNQPALAQFFRMDVHEQRGVLTALEGLLTNDAPQMTEGAFLLSGQKITSAATRIEAACNAPRLRARNSKPVSISTIGWNTMSMSLPVIERTPPSFSPF